MKKIAAAVPIPKECMKPLVISLIVLTVSVCGAVIPSRMEVVRLDKRISEARRKLDEQKNLMSLYAMLQKVSPGVPGKHPGGPAVLPAARAGIETGLDGALLEIRDISKKSSMRAVAIDLDFKSISGGGGQAAAPIKADISFRGDFANFRKFLLALCALPYVEDIGHISIQPASHGRALDFRTGIRLAADLEGN